MWCQGRVWVETSEGPGCTILGGEFEGQTLAIDPLDPGSRRFCHQKSKRYSGFPKARIKVSSWDEILSEHWALLPNSWTIE